MKNKYKKRDKNYFTLTLTDELGFPVPTALGSGAADVVVGVVDRLKGRFQALTLACGGADAVTAAVGFDWICCSPDDTVGVVCCEVRIKD